MRWRRDEPGRLEAEEALKATRESAESIREKEQASRGVFYRIKEIRRRNHIAEAVRDIMEAR